MSYSALSPFIIPKKIQHRKKSNIGDGFILQRINTMLQPSLCEYVFSTREKLSEEDIDKINSTKALILAGANQLNDEYSIVPGADLSYIKKIKVPVVPFGVGISGDKINTNQMSEKTKSILKEIHNRLKYSSWRCPLTINYLSTELPDIKRKFLLTGCPVIYDTKLLNKDPFNSEMRKIVVTVTERDDFWERETSTIDYVAKKFPNSKKYLSLHQGEYENIKSTWLSFLPIKKKKRLKIEKIIKLHNYAIDRGFSVIAPKSVKSCWDYYSDCDFHIGSRLHAHLYFLSQSKKSFLTYVDDRMKGFSDLLAFPLCDYNKFDDYLDYNFEIYRQKSIEQYEIMKKFVNYLKDEIL